MDALYVRRCLEKLAAALHRPSQPVIAWYILHWDAVREASVAQLGWNPSGWKKTNFFILQVADALCVRGFLEKLAAALHRPSQPVIAW